MNAFRIERIRTCVPSRGWIVATGGVLGSQSMTDFYHLQLYSFILTMHRVFQKYWLLEMENRVVQIKLCSCFLLLRILHFRKSFIFDSNILYITRFFDFPFVSHSLPLPQPFSSFVTAFAFVFCLRCLYNPLLRQNQLVMGTISEQKL